MAAPVTINFRVTRMVVQKLRGLLRIRTHFLSMYVYIYIIHGYTETFPIHVRVLYYPVAIDPAAGRPFPTL